MTRLLAFLRIVVVLFTWTLVWFVTLWIMYGIRSALR
jgi:hypothetical protein